MRGQSSKKRGARKREKWKTMPKNLAKEREKGNPCPREEPFPCFVIISDFLLVRLISNSHDGEPVDNY